MKAIELIHNRENILLDIMSHLDVSQNPQKFRKLEGINEELLQVLVFWKYMELPYSSFIYLGEDYYAKIHEDNANLATLFPEFQTEDIFHSPTILSAKYVLVYMDSTQPIIFVIS